MARDPHQLREDAASAVARGKLELALELYGELEQIEPMAAAWPKRVGETYRRMGDAANAVLAFERAVDKYVHDGLLVQAIAVCKLILQIDPHHASTATRLSALATPTPAEARAVRKPSPPQPALEMARRAAVLAGDDRPARRVASDPRRDDPPASRAALLEAAARAPDPAVARTSSRDAEPAVARTPSRDAEPAVARTPSRDAASRDADPAVARTSSRDAASRDAEPAVARTPTRDPASRDAEPAVARTPTRDPASRDAEPAVARTPSRDAASRDAEPAVARAPSRDAASRDAEPAAARTPSRDAEPAVARTPSGGAASRDAEPAVARTPSRDAASRDAEPAVARTPSRDAASRDAEPAVARTSSRDAEPAVARRSSRDAGRDAGASTEPVAVARVPSVRFTEPAVAVRPISPVELAQRAAIRLPPGAGLDAIPLAMVMPDSQRVVRADGTDAGVSLLRIDVAFDDVDDEVEIEFVDPHRMALLKTPVFSGLPADALERLIGQLELRELYNGEELFHEGDSGATMFVISEGEVEVAAYGQDLATLGPGAFFGEISLITDLPRSATIRAKGRVELLALDREVVRGAAVTSPEIITALLSFVRERLVDRVSRTSPLFRPFSEEERATLAARFEVIEVDAGAQLITFGDKADGLYVVLAGKVDVTREGDGSLATLSCGDVFGEMSLMGNRGSTANVHALTRVLALRLPAKVFQEIIVTYPQVLEFLGDLTSSRSRLRRAEEFLDLHITLV